MDFCLYGLCEISIHCLPCTDVDDSIVETVRNTVGRSFLHDEDFPHDLAPWWSIHKP